MGLCSGAAHNDRNLKYQISNHTLIVFHNLSGYDAYLFIRELGKRLTSNKVKYWSHRSKRNEKCISFIVKTNVDYAGVSIKEAKNVLKIFSLGL